MAKMYDISSDWDSVLKEITRLKSTPSLSDKRKLDRTLNAVLMHTQSQVHIRTGSLFASGTQSSKLVAKTYRGHFSYGGFSPGVNNPVDYAIYEQDRGGAHNFMRGVEAFHPLWVKTIQEILKG